MLLPAQRPRPQHLARVEGRVQRVGDIRIALGLREVPRDQRRREHGLGWCGSAQQRYGLRLSVDGALGRRKTSRATFLQASYSWAARFFEAR